jgi:hypothetical protein
MSGVNLNALVQREPRSTIFLCAFVPAENSAHAQRYEEHLRVFIILQRIDYRVIEIGLDHPPKLFLIAIEILVRHRKNYGLALLIQFADFVSEFHGGWPLVV